MDLNARTILRAALYCAGFACSYFSGAHLQAAPPRCALLNTVGTGNRALDYLPRNNRCEGIFERQVATAISMQLIGFQRGRSPNVDFMPNSDVRVRVIGRPANILLRATATIPRTNYSMDTEQVDPSGTFSWSSAILANPQLSMSSDRLALLACTNLCRGNSSTVYFPVEPVQPQTSTPSIFEVSIRAQRDVDSVTYQLKQGTRLVKKGSRTGPLSSSRPISLNLGALPTGIFTLTVQATASDGTSDDLEAVLRVPQSQ